MSKWNIKSLEENHSVFVTGAKILAWLIPVAFSAYAVMQSNAANGIASKALNVGQRPYISLEPAKFDDGKYIFLKSTGGSLTETFRFKIENKGSSVAQNIRITPIVLSTSEPSPQNPQVAIENNIQCSTATGGIALAPGETTYLEIGGTIPISDSASAILLKELRNDYLSVPINVELTYESDALSIPGKVGESLVFWPDKVDVNYSVSN
jgi:hypothetical protein